MVTLGLLRQETDSKRYRVGRMLFSLAAGALDELELLAVAAPILADLAERSGETSHVGVRVGREAVIIGRHDGPSAIRVAERIGAPRPLHATSMGKVLLAQLTDEQVRAYLKAGPLRRVTARTVTDPEALLAIVDEVRLSGVAFDDGEYLVDGRCIAAPVRDFRGGVVCAIGISAPTWRLGIDRVAATEAHVRQAAREFSLALGATDPAEASRRSTPRFTREP
jgi:DNA-binding IclR family transcriptional regulator